MTQNERLLHYLQSHVGITTLTAYEKLGITRLSARIFELRDDGHDIISNNKTVKNRFGDKCIVAEYRLVKGEK